MTLDEVYGFLRVSAWRQATEAVEDVPSADRQSPEFRLVNAILQLHSKADQQALRMLDGGVMALPHARDDLRRFAIPDVIRSGRLQTAVAVLDRILDVNPESAADLRLRGNLHARLQRGEEAIRDARTLVELQPSDAFAQTSYLQLLHQWDRIEEAGAHAETLIAEPCEQPRLANIILISLTRSGRFAAATDYALSLAESGVRSETVAGAIVRTLLETNQIGRVLEVGGELLADGWDDPTIRSALGQAYMLSQSGDRYERAADHFRVGLDLAPDDIRMNSSMGEALLRSRRYEEALPYLERACRLQPRNAQSRALYARALKQVGQYSDAAREFRKLLELQPSSPRWHRYAAGALSQAGRRKEAAELFDRFVAERRKLLPNDFEAGLNALWDQVDSVEIPKARLDWAWSLSHARPNDRDEWERRAKWGHLADHYMLDWLECRDDRVHEAMARLADLSEAERALSGVDRSKGVILASAHVGPMFAGPLALELLGVESRWLASTPSVARTAYAKSLISTSDQDDMQVARSFMISLRQGYAVVIAVDGAINLAAPRIAFEGQEMTYSSFAARTAHRLQVPSLFCAPRWEGDRIGFVMERLPDPLPDEDADSHAERWKDAYLTALRNYLGGAPENLRLSGGIWRHIR